MVMLRCVLVGAGSHSPCQCAGHVLTVAELQEFQNVVPTEDDDENSTVPLCYAVCMYNFVPEEEVQLCAPRFRLVERWLHTGRSALSRGR
jgi:hypothetical protein